MTIGLIFTLLLVSLNKEVASVEKGLEIGGCTLRETREGARHARTDPGRLLTLRVQVGASNRYEIFKRDRC